MTTTTITPLSVPPPDADVSTLREHFRAVGLEFARYVYEVTINLCQTCCREGENTCGKEGGFGRHRYCSQQCEALAKRFASLRSVPA